ncbi:MAG: 3-oxoacyl-ACP reductase FabG [Planctomycetota bacterium]
MNWLVTGGSRGLGAAIVLEAIRAGHDVAFTFKSNRAAAGGVIEAARAMRPEAHCRAYELNVSDAQAIEPALEAVQLDFEPVEVVVNCAGVNRDNLAISMSDQEWDTVIATNLSGPFRVCRHFLPSMLAGRCGRIINVSSIQAGGGSGQANYAASKAGLEGLTRSLAKEYGPKGIRANVVRPGFFETDMTRETMPERMRDYWRDLCPMPGGRMGEAEELARVVLFLASDAASFINGQVIPVTGGLDWTK